MLTDKPLYVCIRLVAFIKFQTHDCRLPVCCAKQSGGRFLATDAASDATLPSDKAFNYFSLRCRIFPSSLIYLGSKNDIWYIFQIIPCFVSQIFGNSFCVWRSFALRQAYQVFQDSSAKWPKTTLSLSGEKPPQQSSWQQSLGGSEKSYNDIGTFLKLSENQFQQIE